RGQLDVLLGHREGTAPAIAAAVERPPDTLALPAAEAGNAGGDYPGPAGGADTARYAHTAEYGLIAEYPPPPGAPAGYSPYDLDAGYPADIEEAQELTCPPHAGHEAEPPETMPDSPYGREYGVPTQATDSPDDEGAADRKTAAAEQPPGGTDDAAAGDQDATEPPGPAPRFNRVRSTPTPPHDE
ncbi:MAG TPA: hypothetical protein VGS19_22045, partial [Streptosporangiaceae bacterium]|nr:hypothetical protein [Streptosporangiaceae bacterium]